LFEVADMARMSREFSLVLLGAGLLTAGYFLWPEEDPLKIANEQAAAGGGGPGTGGRSRHVVFVHVRGARSPALVRTATSRGGFGRVGVGMAGG
jgi:hypothetical protein